MSNLKTILLDGFHPFFRALATSVFLLFSFLVVLRVFEFLFLFTNGIIKVSNFWVLSKSIIYDLNACSVFFILTFPFFLFLKLISTNFSFKFQRGILLIFLFLTLILNYYFYINKELLGFNVFSYSFTEIYLIVSGELLIMNPYFGIFSLLLVSVAAYFFIYKAAYGNRFRGDWITVLLLVVVGVVNLSQLKYSSPVSKEYNVATEFSLAHNKIDFIIRGGILTKLASKNVVLTDNNVANYHRLVPGDYLHKEFPLLRYRDSKNDLGPFFEMNSSTPPNVIFVVCEGLSRVFSGPDAKYPEVTPYLNKLIDSSLYWRNFVSNCNRTFGVLPNVLGSLPHGNRVRGFATLNLYPSHQTLVSLLGKQGYSSSFYYPGWGGFDNMAGFMFAQGGVSIYDQTNIVSNKPKTHKWGYSDRHFFEFYLSQLETQKAPFIDVVMTLSIHHPFDQAEEKHYEQLEKYIEKYPELKLSGFDKKIVASVMYFDDCIKYLIEGLKQSSHFENTILVITGDHNAQSLPLRNEIDRYYVPMYIVSPMLKTYKNMGGVCSHLDIAPSLTQLLNKSFNVPMPDKVSFVGQGLDTTGAFNAERIFPISIYNNNLAQYVYKDILLAGNRVYKIGDGLTMELLEQSQVDVMKLKDDYIAIDKYVSNKNKIIK